MKSRLSLFATLLFLLISLPLAQAQQTLPDNFHQFVEDGLQEWNIPGVAVSVVKDDEVVFAGGFGVQKLSSGEPVNEHTRFGIASVSKNMTAASLALLVDDGLIDWDDRVIDIIPWFRLSDSYATANVTIRDLLTHQVGVGRMLGNRLQFMTNRSTEELLYRMRYHDFEQAFRTEYVYSNVMYTLAGYIVTEVTGMTLSEFMERKFFEPMGMVRTNSSITQIQEGDNNAWPHQEIEGEVVEIPRRNWDNAMPAGGVNSTVSDMTEWMRLHLGEPGVHHGDRIIDYSSIREIQSPQVALTTSSETAPQRSYGFGFSITDYNGYRVLTHGGATDGMNTIFMLVPELNLGIIAVTNTFSSFQQAIAYTILDHYVQPDSPRDWNSAYRQNYLNRYENAMQQRAEFEDKRETDTEPSKPLNHYTGLYSDDLYDRARVSQEQGNLVLTLWNDENLNADLEHWHHNTFRINWRNPALREEFVTFGLGLDGFVDSMEIRFTLRPLMLQVGAYPTNYYRDVEFQKIAQ